MKFPCLSLAGFWAAWLLVPTGACKAQAPTLQLEGVRLLKQTGYEYTTPESKTKTSYKESWFHPGGILYKQNQESFMLHEGQELLSSRYTYQYDTATRKGTMLHERMVTPRNRAYSKHETRFVSLDHTFEKRRSSQKFDTEGKLLEEIENGYDEKGELIKTLMRDHSLTPPLLHTDELQRNAAEKITRWVSYDEQAGSKREQVRDYSWEYLNDTLLLRASGYVYFDWNEIKNTYKKGVISQSVQSIGDRQTNGRNIINYKTLTKYDHQGRPLTLIEYDHNKKTRTVSYRYEPGFVEETTVSKDKTVTVKTTKEVRTGGLLLERSTTKDGKPESSETFQYNAQGQVMRRLITEYRSNEQEWRTEWHYDVHGNPTHRLFSIDKKPKQEDVYEYERFPEE